MMLKAEKASPIKRSGEDLSQKTLLDSPPIDRILGQASS